MKQRKIKDLKPNPQNPRRITPEKIADLKKSYEENGDLNGVVYNVRSEQLIGGHQTATSLDPEAVIYIEKRYDKPTKTGTVAEGYIDLNGERLKYREVDVDSNREKIMNIAANRGAGQWDFTLLTDWFTDLDAANADLNLTMFDAEERDRMLGGWEVGTGAVDKVEENLDGLNATIKVKCPQEIKDEVLIYLKAKFLEVSFEGIEIV